MRLKIARSKRSASSRSIALGAISRWANSRAVSRRSRSSSLSDDVRLVSCHASAGESER
jgi:hypothetical protein